MRLECFTYRQQPELSDGVFPQVKKRVWPEFMFHDPIANQYWHHLEEDFADYQFALRDRDANGAIAAVGHTIPFHWEGELPDAGWDAAFAKAIEDLHKGVRPNRITALEAVIAPEYQGQGVSRIVLEQMRAIAKAHGFTALAAPVRPTWKARYPLIPMERFVTWTQDGSEAPFDPWLRAHWRMGARIVKVAPQSMRIVGSVTEWQTWANMRFPESGQYIVPGALNPIKIDCASNEGVYIEPNVWMEHDIDS